MDSDLYGPFSFSSGDGDDGDDDGDGGDGEDDVSVLVDASSLVGRECGMFTAASVLPWPPDQPQPQRFPGDGGYRGFFQRPEVRGILTDWRHHHWE